MTETKKRRKMLVDQECWLLAGHFLSDHSYSENDQQELAESIQTACEDFMSAFESKGGTQ